MAKSDDSPQIATFERQADGRLSLIHQADIRHRGGYISVDQSGHYLASKSLPRRQCFPVETKRRRLSRHDRTGIDAGTPCTLRHFQSQSDNRWLLVPATLPNKVFVQQFDPKQGTITPNSPPFGAAPTSEDQARHPRHLVFHPKLANVLYTTNESQAARSWCVAMGYCQRNTEAHPELDNTTA